jgi:hypothetical protein
MRKASTRAQILTMVKPTKPTPTNDRGADSANMVGMTIMVPICLS